MSEVYPTDNVSHEQLGYLGFQIWPNASSVRHIGILFSSKTIAPHCLHLAYHHDLRRDEPRLECLWVQSGLSETNRRVMASVCHRVWKKNKGGKIPYNFKFPSLEHNFRKTGVYMGSPNGEGLTCATFVLAVFQDFGFCLMKYDEWPKRASDKAFHTDMFLTLIRSPANPSQEHLDSVRKNIDCVRYRPIEVVAAGTSRHPPLGFDDAIAIVTKIKNQIEAAKL